MPLNVTPIYYSVHEIRINSGFGHCVVKNKSAESLRQLSQDAFTSRSA